MIAKHGVVVAKKGKKIGLLQTQLVSSSNKKTGMATDTLTQENTQLLAAAKAYYALGITVFPCYYEKQADGKVNKKPAVATWEQWNQRDQTEDEFKALDFLRNEAIGVVLGRKTKAGLYFGCVDYDVKGNQSEESKKIGKEIFAELPITKQDQTLNKGLHAYFLSKNPVPTHKNYHTSSAVELLGKGCFSIVYPSKGYLNWTDNDFTVIEDIDCDFLDLLEKHGIEVRGRKKNTTTTKRKVGFASELRPCFIELMKKEHLEHNEKLFLVNECYCCGKTEKETKTLFETKKAWEPVPEHTFDLSKTHYQIESIYREAETLEKEGKSYRNPRATLEELKLCLLNCPLRNMKDCRNQKVNRTKAEEEPQSEANDTGKQPIQLSHINEIENPEYTGETITVEAVVSGASTAYFTPTVINAIVKKIEQGTCVVSEVSEFIGKDNPINMALAAVGLEQRASRIKHMMIGKYQTNLKQAFLTLKKASNEPYIQSELDRPWEC